MKLLLSAGVPMRISSIGETLMQKALEHGCVEAARLLVSSGHCLHAVFTVHEARMEGGLVLSWANLLKRAVEEKKADERQWQWLIQAVNKPELAAGKCQKCEKCGFDASPEALAKVVEQFLRVNQDRGAVSDSPTCANPGTKHTNAPARTRTHETHTQIASKSTQCWSRFATGADLQRLRD